MTTTDDEVAVLVRLAGTSDPIEPLDKDRIARVRTAVHDAWRDDYVARQLKMRRLRLTGVGLLAVTASIVIATAIWRPVRTPAPVPVKVPTLVAHIDQVTGASAPFTTGDAVTSGSTVTTSVGTLTMTLTSGVNLRLDAATSARVDSLTDVVLERGGMYVDGASPISIHTPAGVVHDVGTQFEVRLEDGGVRIRVRDGQVAVTYANGVDARAVAGEELFSKSDGSYGSISRRSIATTGTDWAWAERAAPPFSVEGKTLGAFLDWVTREGAWTVTFADPGFSETARATVLHGRPNLLKGDTPAEALDVILPTCGLRHRIDRNRVVIARETR